MKFSAPTDGFRLAYEDEGEGPPVVLLHGWPGDHTDYDALVPIVSKFARVLTPDLRGFGESDKHVADAEQSYSGVGQANAVIALMDELQIAGAVVCGYDVGSFIAQTIANKRPDLVKALVVSPPLPGGGKRVLELIPVKEFWYTSFQQLALSETLVDGIPNAVRAYLTHFWNHWSGAEFVLEESRIDHLTEVYSAKGAFTASMMWYRSSGNPVTAYAAETAPAPSDRLQTPTTILWQTDDPIFPIAWSDHLDEFFTSYTLHRLEGVGHFTPLEATEHFAQAIRDRIS